jgi:DNA-directed RNA polymerase subunit M/transcription elongation factor TFIIS
MFLYCPKCQNLIEKSSKERKEGETVVKECSRCGKTISFYIKYKAISSVLTRSAFDDKLRVK